MFATEARCYLRERMLQWRIVLLWLLLTGCAALTVSGQQLRLAELAFVCALLLLAFRLWDDLADLEYDRGHSRERCLVRATSLMPFHTMMWLLQAGLAVLLFYLVGAERARLFLALLAALFVMYRITEGRARLRPLRVTLVLGKYPAFVLLLADSPGDRAALLAAMMAYLPPLLDEFRGNGAAMLLPAVVVTGLALLAWLALTTLGDL